MGLTTVVSNQVKWLDDQNPDGTKYSKNPRSNPKQSPIQRYNGGQVVTYQENLTVLVCATITAAEQAMTVGTTAGNGPATTDFLAAVNKPTCTAGLGHHFGRISAANTVNIVLSNPTAAPLTPAPSQVYNVTCLRGVATITQSLTPAVVPTKGTSETIFTIAPTTAVITVTVDGQGHIATAVVTNGGANYWMCPTLVVTDSQGGYGAVLKADISAAGAVTQVIIDDPGYGYVAPTVTVLGGNNIEVGQVAMINKPTQTAGIAISNVRVAGNNQIAVQFINPTAAAITPTAENYVICCLNDIPAISNITSYGVVGTGLGAVASITTAEQAITVNGLLATDIVVGISKPSLQAGVAVVNGRISAANTLQMAFVNPSAAAVTPVATEIYGVTILSQNPVAPFKKYCPVLSPASIAANVTAEQTFTVTGLPFTVNPSNVVVNKQSHQYGLGISGARVTAANTLGITFENVTAAAITPTAGETYVVGCFNAIPGQAGVPGGWIALPFAQSLQDTIGLTQEECDTMLQLGMIKGA